MQTVVIDAGGRYGLHPTWKPFTGELEYYLFEPDGVEATRLASKYAHRRGEVHVVPHALAEKPGVLTLNIFRNRAMTSTVVRNPISALFHGERLEQVEVVERHEVTADAIDGFAAERGLAVDFLKLDTEGTEYAILQGATGQLASSILGVRSEVAFDRIFEGMPLFGALNDFLLERDFFLLNLDYDGRGEYQNEFARIDGKFGVLQNSDAVWLRRRESILVGDSEDTRLRVLKYAAFCFNNGASDVAMDVLLRARRDCGIDFEPLAESRLYRFLDVAVHKLMYGLKWIPGQSLRNGENAYREIFGRTMKQMHEFMQSLDLNPD